MLLRLGLQAAPVNSLLLHRPVALCAKTIDADSTLAVFRSHGIPDVDGLAILARHPKVLTMRREENLEPKLRFLRSAGLTGPDLAQVLLSNPRLLYRSVEHTLAPYMEFLRSILPSEDALIRVLKSQAVINASNVQILKDRGIPDQVIGKMVLSSGIALCQSPSMFISALDMLEELGFHHTHANLPYGLVVMAISSRSSFLRKVRLFRDLGIPSDEDVYGLLRRYPQCFSLSSTSIRRKVKSLAKLGSMSHDKVIVMVRRYPHLLGLSDRMVRRKVEFLMERVGLTSEILCLNPSLLGYSLEKRMIPRCAVLNMLVSRGLLKMKSAKGVSRFFISEERFRDEFVNKYKEEVPLVVDAYHGKIEFRGWGCFEDNDEEIGIQKKQKLLKALE